MFDMETLFAISLARIQRNAWAVGNAKENAKFGFTARIPNQSEVEGLCRLYDMHSALTPFGGLNSLWSFVFRIARLVINSIGPFYFGIGGMKLMRGYVTNQIPPQKEKGTPTTTNKNSPKNLHLEQFVYPHPTTPLLLG